MQVIEARNRLAALLLAVSASWASADVTLSMVFSQAHSDSYLYTAAEPYGKEIFAALGGSPSGSGLSAASYDAVSPDHYRWNGTTWAYQWSVPGSYAATAETAAGVNRAYASAVGGEPVLEGGRQVLSTGMSTWVEGITVTGGSGSGTLKFTARLDGQFTISGPANAEGQTARAGAYLSFLTTGSPFNVEHPTGQGLAFDCGGGVDCDYDTSQFNSLGGLVLEATGTQAIDRSVLVTVPFVYGQTFYLVGAFEVGAVSFNGGATAIADFMHTAAITSFVAPEGATVFLQSGAYEAFALPAPVPEPGTWALMAAGLGLTAVSARRRTRPQAA